MGKRRKVREIASGKVFNTMAAAEREYGIPEGTISWKIGLGKPICGHLFEPVYDDDTAVPAEERVVIPIDKRSIPEKPSKASVKPARISKDELVEILVSHGYNSCVDPTNVVMTYGVKSAEDAQNLRSIVSQSGYAESWGFTPLDSAVAGSNLKNYAAIED